MGEFEVDSACDRTPAHDEAEADVLAPSFSDTERRALLKSAGISHGVVRRIEHAGVGSIEQLRACGVESVVEQICLGVGSTAWRNRRRAITRALSDLLPHDAQRSVAET
jgi:2-methylisocitrate lyase-like PEP mutase family enzyme